MCRNDQGFCLRPSSIVHGRPPSIYIPRLIHRHISQTIFLEQLKHKLRTLLFMERRRRDLLDLDGKVKDAFNYVYHGFYFTNSTRFPHPTYHSVFLRSLFVLLITDYSS